MPVALERWNDDRMDALSSKVDHLGEQLREQSQDLREQLREQGKDLREQLRENRQDLREVSQDLREHRTEVKQGFETLHRMLIQTTVAILTAFIVGFAALISLVALQL